MKHIRMAACTILALLLAGSSAGQIRRSALLEHDRQIDSIISRMTLDEKVNMLHAKHMFVSAGIERLGIADMKYADGPFGLKTLRLSDFQNFRLLIARMVGASVKQTPGGCF